MTKYRETLLDRMIRIYGFEHERVIAFAKFMENNPTVADDILEVIVETHEEVYNIEEEE